MESSSYRLCRRSSLKLDHVTMDEEEDLGFGFVRYSHGLGRKRVGSFPLDTSTALKRQCSERTMMIDDYNRKAAIESLPQDVLTVIAKKLHFAYSTPTKVKAFRTLLDSEFDGVEAPNAPMQWRTHRSIDKKKLADISISLFA
ncbi:putative Heteroproteinous nuclear ribonucleoprotein U-like protein 1 [Hibiscus syriacus]|uniref:Heteroproteinous nuclear ribonucleoprotein U-like protein 1 n=1 Tax=Hibiscus syriacus TaxID=106335 RepID=A0A6A3BSM9_HIBSY|nr:putative Heteroproteinous nuclear ribonucleoprotein U-like protein 1 [Hibiscus syriacus]